MRPSHGPKTTPTLRSLDMSGLQTLRVRDIDVHLRMEGPAEAPVVMLAHGILTSHVMWDGVAELLTPHWRVLRYDLRGHGQTSATRPPYAMSDLAQDAIGLLDELRISKVHFVGSSLGGMLGQRLGADHSHRLHSLTLANTTAVQGTPEAWVQRMATARDKGVQALVEPTLQRWFTEGFLTSRSPEISKMRAIAGATPIEGFLGCAAAVRDLSQVNLLRNIRVPALVIAGEHDAATPPTEARQISSGIEGARLVLLPAAHQSAVECPEAFAAAWSAFATKHSPPIA